MSEKPDMERAREFADACDSVEYAREHGIENDPDAVEIANLAAAFVERDRQFLALESKLAEALAEPPEAEENNAREWVLDSPEKGFLWRQIVRAVIAARRRRILGDEK